MAAIPNANSVSQVQDTFLDGQGLAKVRAMGRDKDPAAMREMARQFESLFMQQMLKSMRSATDVFSEGNYLKSSESDFYQQMLDQQLSLELTKGRGLGLADVLYQQLMQSYGQHFDEAESSGDAPAASTVTSKQPDITVDLQSSVTQDEAAGDFSGVAKFIERVKPYAEWAAQQLGVKPAALIAQAALETGWGKSIISDNKGESSNNLFNVKATRQWPGDSVEVTTTEFLNGEPVKVKASFKQYASLFESFSDLVTLLQQPRYAEALAAGEDSAGFALGLQQAGYATDPHYAEKIQKILSREEFGNILSEGES